MTAVIEGLPAGLSLRGADFVGPLARRQKRLGAGGRQGIERDAVDITAGVLAGRTTGAPLCLVVANRDHANWQNKDIAPMTVPRPGHTDLVGALKYQSDDLRHSSERSSARETVLRVAVGVVAQKVLDAVGIRTGAFVRQIGDVTLTVDDDLDATALEAMGAAADAADTSCPDEPTAERMRDAVAQVMRDKDTLGGVIEGFATGLPAGLGSYARWGDKLDARLGALLLSIPSVKAVAFGAGASVARMRGTAAQDAIRRNGDALVRDTNRAGGLEGGVTNGQPLRARVALKPIASTLTPQASVDVVSGQAVQTHYERSDFCTLPRAAVVVEAMLAIGLCDAVLERAGGDHLEQVVAAAASWPAPRLSSLRVTGAPKRLFDSGAD